MTLPSRAPYCLKCQSFTSLDKGGTECETCGSREIELRETPVLGAPPSRRRVAIPTKPVTPERATALFEKLRASLG